MDYGRTIPRIWLEFILKNYGSRPKRSDLHRFQVELRWKAMVLGKMTRLTRDFQKGWSDQAGGSTTYWPVPIPNLRLACSYYLCVGWFHALHPLILKDLPSKPYVLETSWAQNLQLKLKPEETTPKTASHFLEIALFPHFPTFFSHFPTFFPTFSRRNVGFWHLFHGRRSESLEWLNDLVLRLWPKIDLAVQKIIHDQVWSRVEWMGWLIPSGKLT